MKLQKDKIDTILFDMDGVITSEQSYWYTGALAVYELMYDYHYYGKREIDRVWCHKNFETIYDIVFCGGRTVKAVKNLGVNTNWDLVYVVFCAAKYLDPDMETFDPSYFESVCMFLENIQVQAPALYPGLEGLLATAIPAEKVGDFKRGDSKLWTEINDSFYHWYHGDEEVPGLIESELPLFPIEEVQETLQVLKKAGFRLGIGTGRPKAEILPPIKRWGLEEYFDMEMCVTYDEVVQAEDKTKVEEPLAKPHPFVFQKAGFGKQFSDEEIVGGAVTQEMAKHCLVVGDAASDLLSARAGGFPFAAVLTGIGGQSGRSYFEENQAEFVLNSVLAMKELVEE
ncbi:MAG: HAD family hydrolase [Clostridia bacterium]|nr:HAD family hydrolase [Clostridia bacterium]